MSVLSAWKLCQAHHWTIPTKLEAMWCSKKLRSMVPAGPVGSAGTVSAARDMMVLRKQSAKTREPAPATRAPHALATLPEIVEDMLDLYEWVIEGRTVIVEGMGADIAHELSEQVIFALEEAVERRATYVGASNDVADGDLAVVLLAQQLGKRRDNSSAAFCLAGIHGYASA